jgi:hypothetical protein
MEITPLPGKSYEMEVAPPYCVYAHEFDGRLFYIGKGLLHRPFERTPRRNASWLRQIQAVERYRIHIRGYFETDEAAREEETRLIRAFRPSCNHGYHRQGSSPQTHTFHLLDRHPSALEYALLTSKREAQVRARRITMLEQRLAAFHETVMRVSTYA